MKKIYVLIFLVLGSLGIKAQFNIAAISTNYTQDFNTLTSGTWTDNTTLTGWYANTDLTNPILTYGANTGTTTAAGLYAFGIAGVNPLTDRALGYSPSNAFTGASGTGKGYMGWRLINNTGGPISSLSVTWTGEQWRLNNNAVAQNLILSYQQAAVITSLTAGSWVTTASSFTSPVVGTTSSALDGNAGVNRTANITINISVSIPAGEEIMLRWEDLNDVGNDHFLAIDDITINATGGVATTPDVVLSSPNPAVVAGNVVQGTNNHVIYRFDLAVTTADAVLNGVSVTTAGTYMAAGINNFKCWYSADNIFDAGSDVLLSTKTTALGAGVQVFPTLSPRTITNGSTGYIFVTSDVSCLATVGNSISVNAITTAEISFVSANKSGTAFAGGVQTFTAATVNNVTAPAASVANASSNLTWTNPTSCYNEIMIVASQGAANTGGAPAGDGTAYTGNLNYTAGTAYGNGFVVYKGSVSGQLVTGLTNGIPYFYKFFTRFGTSWSTGVEISQTPAVVTSATDYFRSVASGSWATLATWESSADSISWMASTLVPGAAAAHVVIQSPDSVWLTTTRTTQNLTVLTGAIMDAGANAMVASDRFNLLGTASFYQGGTVKSVPGVVQVLATTSNYHFNGTQDGTANITYPEFGNLYWEPNASQNGTFQNSITTAPFNNGLVVRGNMTVNLQNASPTEVRFATGGGVVRSHIIGGNLNVISPNSIVVFQNGTLAILSTITIEGNINVSSGILRGVNSSGNAIVNLSGSINCSGGILESGAGSGIFSLNYIGTTAQSISNSGGAISFLANQLDTINNVAGLTLNSPITHKGTIRFISGLLNTTAINLLTMDAGSSVFGASNSSFVNGPISKIGFSDFVFPVGKTNCGPSGTVNGYAPLQIWNSIGGLATDRYTAEYIRNNTNFTAPKALGLDRVSKCDYWTLNQNVGASTLNVTLNWQDAINNCTYASPYVSGPFLPTLVVAHYNGATWDTYGPVATATGTQAAGDVTWPSVSVFSPFAIGSVNFNNPLPITINYFNGTKNNGNHLLNWKVTCVSTPSATLEMERSTDGRNFVSIYSIYATALRCAQPFDYTDAQPVQGINYYRLKMTSADGQVNYSTTVTLINAMKGIDIQNIAPNPVVNGTFNLKVSSAVKTQMELLITDMQGRVLQKQTASLIAGFNSLPMNVRNLAAGTYQLFGNSTDGRTKVLRFVIQ